MNMMQLSIIFSCILLSVILSIFLLPIFICIELYKKIDWTMIKKIYKLWMEKI